MASSIFISYRGVDSHSYAALLHAELSRQFGPERVFLDSESVPAGADFPERLLAAVRGCRVLLAVIGPSWLTAAGATGTGIKDPGDWVRREIAEALAGGVRVIPVLTDDASLPSAAELPAEIAGLSRYQYRRLRYRDATADLDRLCSDLLADPAAAAAGRRNPVRTTTWGATSAQRPAQLPAPVRGFVGRREHLARLDALLAGTASEGTRTVLITAISGMAGVGKTALALHWGHQVADRFPDGQLYVNLRGFDDNEQVLDPGIAVRGFLDALGVPAERIPSDPDAQAALYRSVLSGRRLLLVLDNARDAEQVQPLLPGSCDNLVLVTSRDQLLPLVSAANAQLLTLDPLSTNEAHELLRRRLGLDRVAAEPDAAGRIVAACARLPLVS